MHSFKCASCGEVFEAEDRVSECPECGCRVLIHEKGEQFKAKACGG